MMIFPRDCFMVDIIRLVMLMNRATQICFSGSSLEIYEVASLDAKGFCDAVKHIDADVGLPKLDSRYVRFPFRAAYHQSEFILRQALLQTEFAYCHAEFL